MFLFHVKEMLTIAELNAAKRHFAWAKKYIQSDYDQFINKVKTPQKLIDNHNLRKQSLNEIAEACLNRELGLKRYSVIRYLSWNEFSFEFMIDKVELINNHYNGLELILSGNKLRQNGTIGSNKESISLYQGFIERRMLDGSWHSIIPTNPIWTD